MIAKVNSGATVGLEPLLIEVEVSIDASGFPSFTIVGLPDKAVEESKERVRSALKNSGADFPQKRITVNLAPADFPKEGPSFDLPIALGILLASGQFQAEVGDSLFTGEISLDGSLRPTRGVLPATILAKNQKLKRVFVPKDNLAEASIVGGPEIFAVASLKELYLHLRGEKLIDKADLLDVESLITGSETETDFADVKGQEGVKRALEIAAAGGHNLLMKGPPGSGKTLLARTFPSILPRLTVEEALEVTKIYSIAGLLSPGSPIVGKRPFRSPHHTISRVGLVGGGNLLPGEISLAHRGVLFLDEFSEFPRHVLESLRQPVEDGTVTISRAAGSVVYPSKFVLIASQNPCPCGYLGDRKKACICGPSSIARYRKRVSGPLLDRIDIHIEVPSVEIEKLDERASFDIEKSGKIRGRVQTARDRQTRRFKGLGLTCNAEMSVRNLREFCPLSAEIRNFLSIAANTMNITARSYHRLIKVSRTIADLAGVAELQVAHFSEALQYRFKEEI